MIAPITNWSPSGNAMWSTVNFGGGKRSLLHHSVATSTGACATGMTRPPISPYRRAASTTGKKKS